MTPGKTRYIPFGVIGNKKVQTYATEQPNTWNIWLLPIGGIVVGVIVIGALLFGSIVCQM